MNAREAFLSSSPRSLCAKLWHSSHSRSHTALAADLLRTQRPASAKAVAQWPRRIVRESTVRVVLALHGLLHLGLERQADHQPRRLANDSTRIDLLAAEHFFKTLSGANELSGF